MSVSRSWADYYLGTLSGTKLIEVNETLRSYILRSSGTLIGNLRILPVSTPPLKSMVELVLPPGVIDLDGYTFEFFTYSLSQEELDTGGILRAFWTGNEWVVEGIGIAGTSIRWDLRFIGVSTTLEAKGDYIYLEAGEDMVFGDACYVDTNTIAFIASQYQEQIGLFCCIEPTLALGETGRFLVRGMLRDSNWTWTPGSPIYISEDGGSGTSMTHVIPTMSEAIVQVLGFSLTSDIISWNPSNTWIKMVP